MKNNNKTNSSETKRRKGFQLFGDKNLFVVFAALSLAFALFYTFARNTTTHASSAEFSAASSAQTLASANSPLEATSTATVSDVVAKAQAFKATLTAAQIATVQQTYTTTLARRWSNLPCGSGCRNGIQFSTLTSAQLSAALAVVQAAMGTTANDDDRRLDAAIRRTSLRGEHRLQ